LFPLSWLPESVPGATKEGNDQIAEKYLSIYPKIA